MKTPGVLITVARLMTATALTIAAVLTLNPSHASAKDVAASVDTIIVGDSITVLGRAYLHPLRPDWKFNAKNGRRVAAAPRKIRESLDRWGTPTNLVVALGQNPSDGWRRADYAALVDMVPSKTHVFFVTTYKEQSDVVPRTQEEIAIERTYSRWMRRIADAHTNVWVIKWRMACKRGLVQLVDGSHPDEAGQEYWSEIVLNTVEAAR